MKITIGYLYHDLLNLYGDSGNIKTLLYHLKEQGIETNVKYMSINDKKEFNDVDILYIGSGTDDNLLVALDDIKKDKDKLKKYIDDKKFILSTGNSVELFGNYIVSDKKIEALGLFDYVSMHQKRIVKDIKVKTNIINEDIIGFENHIGNILSNEDSIIKIDNFYGTYIIGPILVRNPKFCSYLIKELILNKNKDFNFKEENYKLDELAYSNVK